MIYEWDEAKRSSNLAKHGVDFRQVYGFDWSSVIEKQDTRRNYNEIRWRAFGLIGNQVYLVVYTKRESRLRLISVRKANRREALAYVTAY